LAFGSAVCWFTCPVTLCLFLSFILTVSSFRLAGNDLLAGGSSGLVNVNFQLTVNSKNRKMLPFNEIPELRLPAVMRSCYCSFEAQLFEVRTKVCLVSVPCLLFHVLILHENVF
jgi:hypothetical protein